MQYRVTVDITVSVDVWVAAKSQLEAAEFANEKISGREINLNNANIISTELYDIEEVEYAVDESN